MNARSRHTWTCLAVGALLTAAPLVHADSFAVGDKPKTADRLDFQVDLQPWNAFADANKAGAKMEFSRGELIRLVIHGVPRPGFHTYPVTTQYSDEPGNVSKIRYGDNDGLQALWPIAETPAPESVYEKGVGFYLEHGKPFTWAQNIYIKPDAAPGLHHLTFKLPQLQVCDANSCLFGDYAFDVPFTVIDGPLADPPADLQQRLQAAKPTVALVPPPPDVVRGPPQPPAPAAVAPAGSAGGNAKTTVQPATVKAASAPGGLWDLLGFMWQGVIFGAISLLTPCVFPMIPITVSFFLKQSEKSAKPALAGAAAPARRTYSPVLLAAVYSLTIALVLTVAGVLLLRLVQPFSQHWATNLVLGGLFIFFALSLFGMYDITLPSWLGRLTSGGEGRGGLVGVVCMALTFTVISFACVAPFYGGFIALTASADSASDWLKLVLGALAFSVTFALPFFVLALFPSLLKALPKSGSWMNTVKVVMGFLELAAAFKFLRAAEIRYFVEADFLTYDLVLGIYIALAVACGLYLLGVYRLPHDHGAPESLTVPRLLFSILFLGLALYMLPGLFKTGDGSQQRPQGTVFAWLDSFLLPPDESPPAAAPGSYAAVQPPTGRLAWFGDLQQGLQAASTNKQLVFLDFTAQTCTNCKYNEGNIFTRPEIKNLLGQYVRVRLYTDDVPPSYKSSTTGEENSRFQHDTFKDAQLPLYVILKPKSDGGYDVVGSPYKEGKINDVNGFAKYLQDALGQIGEVRAEAKGG